VVLFVFRALFLPVLYIDDLVGDLEIQCFCVHALIYDMEYMMYGGTPYSLKFTVCTQLINCLK